MMQFTPTLSADLLSPGRPVSPSTGTSGQDGVFADHLSTAVQGQGASSRSPVPLSPRENSPSRTEDASSGATEPAAPTADANDLASTPTDPDPAAPEDLQYPESSEPVGDATLNGSAGALSATILPLPWANLDRGRTGDQDLSQPGAKSNSIVDQLLSSITAAGQQSPTTAAASDQAVSPPPATPPAEMAMVLPEQPVPGIGPSPLINGPQGNLATETAPSTVETIAIAVEPRQSLTTSLRHNIPTQAVDTKAAAALDLAVDQGQATPPVQVSNPGTSITTTAAMIAQRLAEYEASQAPPPSAQTPAIETPDTTAIDLSQAGPKDQATPPAPTLVTTTAGTLTTATTDLSQAGPKGQAVTSAHPLTTGAAHSAAASPTDRTGQPPVGDQIVQNQYGQILTIHQTGDSQESTEAAGRAGATAPLTLGGQVQDINSNYIRSHLPNEGPKTVTNEPDAQQRETGKDNQPKDASLIETLMEGANQTEEAGPGRPQFTLGSENQPLIFASQSTKAALTSTASSTDALTLRLPSNLTVSTGTVVDQMAAHFANTRPLESGTVNLRLHPQELGELRMEIKVEQDNIKAHIIAQNPQAQEMIDRHLPRLREALAQQGLHLQQIEVTVADGNQSGEQRFQDNTRQQLSQSLHKDAGHALFTLDPDEETVESTSSANNLSVLA